MISNYERFGPWQPKVYRNRYLLNQAKDQSCIKCGDNTPGAIVAAHYHGKYGHLFGRGTGIKADDFMTAHLCHACHWQFDAKNIEHTEYETKEARDAELFACIALTWKRLIDSGMITIRKGDA